jgi:hypothetical protein
MREPGLGETGVQLQHVLDAWAHAGSMAWRCGKCQCQSACRRVALESRH